MRENAQRQPPVITSTAHFAVLPPAGRWILHADAAARRSIASVFGVGCSEEACRALVAEPRATLWLGPEEYLLLDFGTDAADPAPHAATSDALERALGDAPHALVDVSHRQFAVRVRGVHAATLLNGACPLDLELRAFPVGMCTRTVLAKAEIVLWRTEPQTFHVEAWRSFAPYVAALLAELGSDVDGPSALA